MNTRNKFLNSGLTCWVIATITLLAAYYTWPIFDQDEAAYAGFAMNMLESGDYLTPQFTWSDVHRKTPLHFWMISLCYKVFGYSTFITRLPALFSILGTCYLVWNFVSKQFSIQKGNLALLIISGNFLLGLYARMSVTDGPLLFFQTLAAISLIRFVQMQHFKYAWFHLLALSLGMLQKGPAMLIFSGLIGLSFFVFSKNGRKLFRPGFLSIQLLSFMPIGLWAYLAWQKDDGRMIQWMLDWYVLNRIGENVFGQTGPPGYHLAMIFLSFLTLIPLLAYTFYSNFLQLKEKRFEQLLIILWALAAWLPFEFTSSKLPSYALGAYPAFAILMSLVLVDIKASYFKWIYLWNSLILASAAIVLLIIPIPETQSITIALCIFLFSLSAVCLALIGLKNNLHFSIALIQNLFTAGLFCLITYGLNSQFDTTSTLAKDLSDTPPVVIYLDSTIMYYPSLPLYLEWETGNKPNMIVEDINSTLKANTSTDNVFILSLETFTRISQIDRLEYIVTTYDGYNTGRNGLLQLRMLKRK